jgi:hypothetical protein
VQLTHQDSSAALTLDTSELRTLCGAAAAARSSLARTRAAALSSSLSMTSRSSALSAISRMAAICSCARQPTCKAVRRASSITGLYTSSRPYTGRL